MKKNLLCDMKPGERAEITFVPEGGNLGRRFTDLGLTPGTVVECVLKAPLGDPSAYRIRGAVIAIRSCDCSEIETEELH